MANVPTAAKITDTPLTNMPGKAPLELVEEDEPLAVESLLAAAREALLPSEEVVGLDDEVALDDAVALDDEVGLDDESAELLAAEAVGDVEEEAAAGAWICEVTAEVALTSSDLVVSAEGEGETGSEASVEALMEVTLAVSLVPPTASEIAAEEAVVVALPVEPELAVRPELEAEFSKQLLSPAPTLIFWTYPVFPDASTT